MFSAKTRILEAIYETFKFENGIFLQDIFIQGGGVHEGGREHQNLHYEVLQVNNIIIVTNIQDSLTRGPESTNNLNLTYN